MKNYRIFPIDAFPWDDNGCRPESAGGLCLEDDALHLLLRSRQASPRCQVTQYGGPLCTDDCLEFFLAPSPRSDLYLNFEVNAQGVYHLGLGPGRNGRAVFTSPAEGVTVEPFRDGEFWGVRARFDRLFFERWFGAWPLTGLKGNFYKCGDATEKPHWGMWTPYDLPRPDFHRPELFPALTL